MKSKYKTLDEDGFQETIHYKHNVCLCGMDCYSDELMLWEDGDDPESTAPYRLKIEGSELKRLILDLLDGSLKITKVD